MISVIMPVYNTEAYLRQSVESVLNQSLRDFELLAVDDGSQDASGAILDDYAAQDNRVRVYHIANEGVSNARNFALEQARGDYVAFVDSDDFAAPELLETLLSLTDGSGRDAAMCDATDVYPDGQTPSGLTAQLPETAEGPEILRIFLGRSGTLWNKLIGRKCIGGVRFPKGVDYCEDLLFLMKTAPQIDRLRVTPKPLYFYRRARAGSAVSSGLNKSYLDFIRAMDAAFDVLSASNLHCEAVTRVRLCAGRVLKAAADVPFSASRPYRDALKPLLRKGNAHARALLKDDRKNPLERTVRYLQLKACCIAPEAVVLFYKLLRTGRKPTC